MAAGNTYAQVRSFYRGRGCEVERAIERIEDHPANTWVKTAKLFEFYYRDVRALGMTAASAAEHAAQRTLAILDAVTAGTK